MQKVRDFFSLHVLDDEGSTRPVALMRIGLVFLIWTRWAGQWLPFRTFNIMHPEIILIGFSFYLFTLLMLAGVWARWATLGSGITLLVVYYYLGHALGMEPATHHHVYLLAISTTLLALTPCGKSFSWDRYAAAKKALRENKPLPEEKGPLWATRLIALQLSIMYLATAYDKTNLYFLSGVHLESLWMRYYGSDYPAVFDWPAMSSSAAIFTVILEYVLAFGLWIPRFQKWLIPVGVIFHLMLYYLLPVWTFSLTVCLLYLSFIPPKKIHNFIDFLVSKPPSTEQ